MLALYAFSRSINGLNQSLTSNQVVVWLYMQRAMLLWTPHPAERDAWLANEALILKDNSGHRHYVIMEIACTRTSRDLFGVREDYHARYKRSLEGDVAFHTTGDFRKVIVFTCNR